MINVLFPRLPMRLFAIFMGFVVLLSGAGLTASAREKNSRWQEIKAELFKGQVIHDGSSVIKLVAPKRAINAAMVPITVNALSTQQAGNAISKLYIIIDRNPVPLAGVITFHDLAKGWKKIATRIRVNEYSKLRIIAQTADARLYMVSQLIKASGGCSARPLNSQKVAMARIGQMTFNKPTIVKLGEPRSNL